MSRTRDGSGATRAARLVRAEASWLAAVEARLRAGAQRAGDHLACRPGCTPCCMGPFPISALDAWRLRRGMQALREADPDRAEAVARRARDVAARMVPLFPGDAATGVFGSDDGAEESFCDRFAEEPCPALDPQSGACELYQARPLSCRTFGLPVHDGGADLPPCRLCFVDATSALVESCRVEPDPEDGEGSLLEAWVQAGGHRGETTVAFALAVPEPGSGDVEPGAAGDRMSSQ